MYIEFNFPSHVFKSFVKVFWPSITLCLGLDFLDFIRRLFWIMGRLTICEEMVVLDDLNASCSPSLSSNQKQSPKQWGMMKPVSIARKTETYIQRSKELEKVHGPGADIDRYLVCWTSLCESGGRLLLWTA